MTYSVMSAAFTLSLTCTIQPELSFGLTVFVFQSMRPGKDATTPLPSWSACELNPLSPCDVNR